MESKKKKTSEQPSSEEDLEGLLQRLINKVTPPSVPVEFSTSANRDWTSPPFYTHPRGYKMALVISYEHFKPLRKAAYPKARIPVYTSTPAPAPLDNYSGCYASFVLLQGEYDDYLRFPI